MQTCPPGVGERNATACSRKQRLYSESVQEEESAGGRKKVRTLRTPGPWQTTQPRSALRDQSTHGFATSVYTMSVFIHRESLVSNAHKSHKTL